MKKIMGVAAVAAMLALTGCSTDSELAKAPSVEPAATASPSSSPEPEGKSERGNQIKTVGEGAGVTNMDDESIADFTINSIAVDPGCTSEYAGPPENGHFLVLDISMETYAALGELSEISQTYMLNPYDMKIIAPNGTTSNANLSTSAAFMCLNSAEQFPSGGLGPAEKATGKMVLDVEVPSGTLVISNYGSPGWEYTF